MDWDDVMDILYDGDKEQISDVRCPACGGKLWYSFYIDTFKCGCKNCGLESIGHKSPVPNCVNFFGKKYDWNGNKNR